MISGLQAIRHVSDRIFAHRFLDSCVVRWVNPCSGPDTESAIELMVYRETFRRALYFDIYVDGLYLVLLYIGPLCILVYMNVRLVQAIR